MKDPSEVIPLRLFGDGAESQSDSAIEKNYIEHSCELELFKADLVSINN